MTLHVFSKIPVTAPKRSATFLTSPKPMLVASLMTLVASWSGAAAATEGWQDTPVTMIGVANYFREVCREFSAGDKVEYRFTSAHPVNFNIHHHPNSSTVFLLKKESLAELSGNFTAATNDHYCFTWTNLVELGAQEWDVQLQHRVSPK